MKLGQAPAPQSWHGGAVTDEALDGFLSLNATFLCSAVEGAQTTNSNLSLIASATGG